MWKHLMGLALTLVLYAALLKPSLYCQDYIPPQFLLASNMIESFRFERRVEVVRERAQIAIGADIAGIFIRDGDRIVEVASQAKEDQEIPVRGLYNDTQREYYKLAHDRGCVEIDFVELAGTWAKSYRDQGVNYALMCSIYDRSRGRPKMQGVLAFGYLAKESAPSFEIMFAAVARHRESLSALLAQKIDD